MPIDEQNPESAEFTDSEEQVEQELSLEQLSEAYAKVIRERKGEDESDGGDSGQTNVSSAEARESGRDESAESSEVDAADLLEYAASKKKKKRRSSKSLETLDKEDNSPCPISPESILEAVLFVGAPQDVKLTGRKIAALMRDISPKEVKKIAKELNQKYEAEDAAFRVSIESGIYGLRLAEEMLPLQNHFFGRDRAAKLSQGAIDTLAIVAYNQPVARDQVDVIRGKSSGALLNQLVKRDLLNLEVTTSKPTKKLYSTTERFLDLFGLEDLNDLPQTSSVSDLEELAD